MLTCICQNCAELLWQLCLVQCWGDGVDWIITDSADERQAGMLREGSDWLSLRMLAWVLSRTERQG